MSKILYLSVHSILEFDEVKLLHELGHEVFSPGAYVEPANPGDGSLRPNIPGLTYDPDLVEEWKRHENIYPERNGKEYLFKSPHIVNKFDIIIDMHMPDFILSNWEVIKKKRVIWRTIGQSVASTETKMKKVRDQGMEIVRYSPKEVYIPGFIGQDALIRFYKDPADYGNWNGENKRVITFAQHMRQRDVACNFSYFEEVTRRFPRHLFGPGNEGMDWSTGKVSFEQQKKELQNNRVYFYTGTHPASYTLNFMEAWMTGIPIVAIGKEKGNGDWCRNHDLYEVHELIQNGITGFVSNNTAELQDSIRGLLANPDIARKIGEQGREEAIRHFGKDMIKEAWRAYLDK